MQKEILLSVRSFPSPRRSCFSIIHQPKQSYYYQHRIFATWSTFTTVESRVEKGSVFHFTKWNNFLSFFLRGTSSLLPFASKQLCIALYPSDGRKSVQLEDEILPAGYNLWRSPFCGSFVPFVDCITSGLASPPPFRGLILTFVGRNKKATQHSIRVNEDIVRKILTP